MSGKSQQTEITQGKLQKITKLLRSELEVCQPRLWLAQLLLAPLPIHVGGRLRAKILSWIGFNIGDNSVMWGMPTITGPQNLYRNLSIGKDCWFNVKCHLDLGAPITFGDRVSVGHEVMFLTTTHEIGSPDRRAGAALAKPIHIGNGVWFGARSTILPGVSIHDGAVIGAGAVITRDVPPHSIVAGVPAVVIRELSTE